MLLIPFFQGVSQVPTMTCPSDITVVTAPSSCSAVVVYTIPSCLDNCGGASITQTDGTGLTSGSTFPLGTTQLAYTITGPGGSSNCNFSVQVTDGEPPVVTCPGSQFVGGNSDCEAVLPNYLILFSATDNCDPSLTKTQSPLPGTIISSSSLVTLTATDDFGNSSSCSFTASVIDVVSPEITCPGNQFLYVGALCSEALPDYSSLALATDNCDSNPLITQNPTPGTVLSGVGSVQTVTLTARDAGGLQSNCTFSVTLADSTAPTIACPGNLNVPITGNCDYTLSNYTLIATVSDNCDMAPVVVQSPAPGTNHTGVVTVTLTATDAHSNTSSCSFNVIPFDNESPIIVCSGDIASCDSVISFSTPTATDNCAIAAVFRVDTNQAYVSGSVFPVGETTITYVAEDIVGNTDTCSFTVTVHPPAYADAGEDVRINEFEEAQLNADISPNSSFSWNPLIFLNNPNTLQPVSSAKHTVEYTLNVTTVDGCVASDGVTVFVNPQTELVVNNILTPNGDGKNDTWDMNKPALIAGCKVMIYNRWGKEVWSSALYNNDWGGTNMRGQELPEGVYYYQIDCVDGQNYQGSVTLIRLNNR